MECNAIFKLSLQQAEHHTNTEEHKARDWRKYVVDGVVWRDVIDADIVFRIDLIAFSWRFTETTVGG